MPVRDAIEAIWSRFEPSARLVDWSLFLFVWIEVVSGLVSFTVGDAGGWPLFWLHRIVGLTIGLLLGYKFARVAGRLTNPDRYRPSTAVSAVAALAAIGALATGLAWAFGLDVRIAHWTLLSVHVGVGLVLAVLVVVHTWTRFRRPRREDFEGRRTAVQYAGLLLVGAVGYRVQELLNRVLETPGADRRFTGSQPREGGGNGSFPVTSWVADDPDPIDREDYRLSVAGRVGSPIELPVEAVAAGQETRALLDCTSGWYTVQDWQGVRVGDLLEAAGGPTAGAEWVRFVSVTGYRWSLPTDEAVDALLATHVGGDRLAHGHGGPVRLVAPGRRGFQWVKWVERVEVRSERDPAQWLVTLTSGFD